MADLTLHPFVHLDCEAKVDDLLQSVLIGPVKEFLGRPGKQFRGKLVEIGFRLVDDELNEDSRRLVERAAGLLEKIHAGSLVVDDIQDESEFRRGQPALHRQYGVPIALNVGNWLYFEPLENVREWELTAEKEVRVYRLCHQALSRAHLGQAIDLGVAIDTLPRARIAEACWASLELKTGELTGMGIALGGLLAGATEAELQSLLRFGKAFGVALQSFDDLGNLGVRAGADPKQLEDLRLRRPSAVWALTAEAVDEKQFSAFRKAVEALPRDEALWQWMEENKFSSLARERTTARLDEALRMIEKFREQKGGAAWAELKQTAQRLAASYG